MQVGQCRCTSGSWCAVTGGVTVEPALTVGERKDSRSGGEVAVNGAVAASRVNGPEEPHEPNRGRYNGIARYASAARVKPGNQVV